MAIGLTTYLLLSGAQSSGSLFSIKSQRQKERAQLNQAKSQARIQASEQTLMTLSSLGKSIAAQEVSSAALGLSPVTDISNLSSLASVTAQDLSAIESNLMSVESAIRLQDIESKGRQNAAISNTLGGLLIGSANQSGLTDKAFNMLDGSGSKSSGADKLLKGALGL